MTSAGGPPMARFHGVAPPRRVGLGGERASGPASDKPGAAVVNVAAYRILTTMDKKAAPAVRTSSLSTDERVERE